MYKIQCSHKVLFPLLSENEARYWADRAAEVMPYCVVQIVPGDDDWLTASLPQTCPRYEIMNIQLSV